MGGVCSRHAALGDVLLALGAHDLKRAVHGMASMIDTPSLEDAGGRLGADEAARIADHIADMQRSIGELLAGVDGILAVLEKANPVARQVGVIVQCFETESVSFAECDPYRTAHRQWLRDLSGLPPHVWSI